MTLDECRVIVAECRYRDWCFHVDAKGEDLYLAARFMDGKWWTGRKWLISRYATRSEVVQTALKAVLTAIEHEAREHFTYRQRAIFGPHFDVESLVTLVDSGREDRRS